MLSLNYELSVPGFPIDEIGFATLVRCQRADIKIQLTNDGESRLHKLYVRPVVESYAGQQKPILFWQAGEQVIDELPPKSILPVNFALWPNLPGLVSVAVHISYTDGKVIMAKRQTETTYQELPVRWWFYVVDNIEVKTLRAIKALVKERKSERVRGTRK